MPRSLRATILLTAVALVLAAAPAAARAQDATLPERINVVSANPFGLLLDLFNAEYERVVTQSSTAGVGGSFYPNDVAGESSYLNLDAFWRFYPSGRPFDGWSFGAKAGYTTHAGAGFGFDVNRSWLLGANENFYVGVGFGLKRIIASSADNGLDFVPTFRLINVGFAF